ncbi:MmgE/PrpD family protein [Sporomusa sp.]|uniref:MmgE/PrpD family protein n=1 Tax=Sporomusa sp. TaxID=2078658 RepID=UPI002BA4E537|nr:MmgE/PrpD family protein [Sporomusa sp.]HWR08787.1 MmgE/PrpD family protein [Sporomusa sp.]
MNETRVLSEFIADISYDKLPDRVIAAVKKCLIDYVGVAAFASQTDMGKIITSFCSRNNFGHATILPDCKAEYGPSMAAMANGTLAHGFELDDINTPSASHPGAVIMAASIALGEEIDADGKQLIEAIVAGYEVMMRAGVSIAVHHLRKGFHPTASFGTFGATAACAKLLGLNADQVESALGLAGSFASGLAQFSVKGSMVKRIHAGKAAEQGVIIAQLAKDGFKGPAEILEGKFGFCRVFKDADYEPDYGLITKGLGETYAVEDITVKPSAACGVLHPVVDCLEIIKKNADFVPDLDAVDKIIVKGHTNLVEEHNTYEPDSILTAQYSLPFTVGLSFWGNVNDAKNYLDVSILKNPTILAWGRKVTTQFDQEVQSTCPALFGAKVEVVMTDGRSYKAHVRCAKGGTENPYTFDEVAEKYKVLVADVFTPEMAENIAMKVRSVEKLKSVRNLFEITKGLVKER